jgi:hypothetical protein
VHGRDDGGVGGHGAHLVGQRVLEVAVTAALADPGAAAVHGHAAGDDEIDVRQLGRGHRRAEDRGPLDRGGRSQAPPQPARIEVDEASRVRQPGDGDVDGLALPQRAQAHGPLGSIGIALQRAGGPPLGQGRQALCGRLGPYEVGDPVGERQWETPHPAALQQSPDPLAQRLFRRRPTALIHRYPHWLVRVVVIRKWLDQ